MYASSFLPDPTAFRNNSGWFAIWGILLMILGVVAAGMAALTTYLTVMILGAIIFIGGLVLLFDTFKFMWGHWGGFILSFVISVLYIAAGAILFKSPLFGGVTLTLFLGFFYVFIGIFRLVSVVSFQGPFWGWNLFNAIISLVLGMLILFNWPMSGLFIIGLFVGIDLFFVGLAYLMLSISAKNYA